MLPAPARYPRPAGSSGAATMLNKVPAVRLASRVIKIMSATVGETGNDYLAAHVGLGTALKDGVMAALLAAALAGHLRARRYVPWIYWLTVVLASVVRTQINAPGLGPPSP